MQFETFLKNIQEKQLPADITIHLKAMWYDAIGDWHNAHTIVDSLADTTSCWVHAYLHRKEGDLWNADYWYNKAGRKRPGISLQQEWETIVRALL